MVKQKSKNVELGTSEVEVVKTKKESEKLKSNRYETGAERRE